LKIERVEVFQLVSCGGEEDGTVMRWALATIMEMEKREKKGGPFKSCTQGPTFETEDGRHAEKAVKAKHEGKVKNQYAVEASLALHRRDEGGQTGGRGDRRVRGGDGRGQVKTRSDSQQACL
jgi:hypothetical protein